MIKVAIADDQSLFRKALAAMINNLEGFEVIVEAKNGAKLISKLDSNNLPDVYLLDLRMPKMNGVETTEYLKDVYGDVKIIIISVHDDTDIITHMYEKGVNAYLDKNSEPEEVFQALRQVYHSGHYFNSKMKVAMEEAASGRSHDLHLDNEKRLTDRELEVLRLLCEQKNNHEIADRLNLSKRTIDGHRVRLMEKTRAKNTAGLVLFAVKHKLLDTVQLRLS